MEDLGCAIIVPGMFFSAAIIGLIDSYKNVNDATAAAIKAGCPAIQEPTK